MNRHTKRALLRACKIDEPVPPGDPRHYDFDTPVQLRGRPWRQKVLQVIDYNPDATTQIVTGQPGSGKSTELKQLVAELEEVDYHVVLADAGAWIRDDAPITHIDILLALVLALYPEARPTRAAGWVKRYAEEVRTFLLSEVKIGTINVGVGLKVALATDTTLFQQAAQRLSEVGGLRERVFKLLKSAASGAEYDGRPLVIILDGIEKRATGDLSGPEEREKYRNHWFGAFLTHARDLRPPTHVVYTVPPFMVRRANELGNQFGQELLFLPMVRVFQRDTGTTGVPRLEQEGVKAMCRALFKRVAAEHFEDPGVAAWLAVHSGGYMRDLLRLVIECIYRTPTDERISRAIAEQAIQQVRQTYLEGLAHSDANLLRQVHRDRSFPLEITNHSKMDALLQGYLMLRYQDAEAPDHEAPHWYDAHPLLWGRLEITLPSYEDVTAQCG